MLAILPIPTALFIVLTINYFVVGTQYPEPMDPKFNGEWSASEIRMVKSLIASHNASNNSNDMNKKHNNIVNQLQAWFPLKEKHQVIKLYVELVVEMMRQPGQSGNQSMVAVNNLVNDNYGIPVEDPTMNNMNMPLASLTGKKSEATRVVEEAPQRQVIIPQQERRQKGRLWTKLEHRLIFFLDMS